VTEAVVEMAACKYVALDDALAIIVYVDPPLKYFDTVNISLLLVLLSVCTRTLPTGSLLQLYVMILLPASKHGDTDTVVNIVRTSIGDTSSTEGPKALI